MQKESESLAGHEGDSLGIAIVTLIAMTTVPGILAWILFFNGIIGDKATPPAFLWGTLAWPVALAISVMATFGRRKKKKEEVT